jgi:ribonucleoside-diphosphate reductase alpha chain
MTDFLDSFSEETWRSTYKYHRDAKVDDTFARVAAAIASVEDGEEKKALWSRRFAEMLADFKVVVGGRITANAGTDWKGTTLLNCFVGPRPKYDFDSVDGIVEALRSCAQTLKSEGGWGFNFSFLRPRGAGIAGVGVDSPGAVSWMEPYDVMSKVVTAGSGLGKKSKTGKGKIRKGAMMAILDVTHPDIVEFITAKQTAGRLSKFNMSVNATAAFMEKVLRVRELQRAGATEVEIRAADDWDLVFPETTHPAYKEEWDGILKNWVRKGYPVVVHKTVSATWLWNLVMEATYNRAEPGVLFLDRADELAPASYLDTIFASNPCGEQIMPQGQVCNLGSVNLTQFVNADGSDFDHQKLREWVPVLVRFLDNVNSFTGTPLPEYDWNVRNRRRIGVGVMGWGSALLMLRTRFGSARAAELREQVMRTIAHAAYSASIDLAEEKGAFVGCDNETHAACKFLAQIGFPEGELARLRKSGVRNSSVLSCQPTGNGSIFANVCSGGIEPVFSFEYTRTVIVPDVPAHLSAVTPAFHLGEFHETAFFKSAREGDEDILRGVDDEGTVWKIDRNRGLTREVPCVDYGVRWLKARGLWDPAADWAASATNLTVAEHVDDLSGFAKYIDSSISKTVNIPHDYPFESFKDVYLSAYGTGFIKGLTTYRAGTMTSVLSTKDEATAAPEDEEIILEDVKLPDNSPAMVKTIRADGRKWYLTVILDTDQKRPIALFVKTNHPEKGVTTGDVVERLFELAESKGIPARHVDSLKAKIDQDNNPSKIARAISLNLRHGVLIRNIVTTLDKVDAPIGSFLFQVRKFLMQYLRDGEKIEGKTCEACGSHNIVLSEGCYRCADCGASKCG